LEGPGSTCPSTSPSTRPSRPRAASTGSTRCCR
jgi:hypothetical protein